MTYEFKLKAYLSQITPIIPVHYVLEVLEFYL